MEAPVPVVRGRAVHLPSEDGNLVTEHDDFDDQIGVVGPS